MSEFTEQKKLIVGNLEHGDKTKIALAYKVSRPTLDSALAKCCISEMSEVELRAWNGCLDYVKNKAKERDRIEKETSKVAGLL